MIKKVSAEAAREWIEKNPLGPLDRVIYGLFDNCYLGEVAVAYRDTGGMYSYSRIECDIIKSGNRGNMPPYAILRREIDKKADKNHLEFTIWRTHCDYDPTKLIEAKRNRYTLSSHDNHSFGCSINYTSIPIFKIWGASAVLKKESEGFIGLELEKVLLKYNVKTRTTLRDWYNKAHIAEELQERSAEKLEEANKIIAPFIKKVA